MDGFLIPAGIQIMLQTLTLQDVETGAHPAVGPAVAKMMIPLKGGQQLLDGQGKARGKGPHRMKDGFS